MTQSLLPIGSNKVYYTSLGWVDTAVMPRVVTLSMYPVLGTGDEFEPSAISITLAGMASKCRPDVAASDSRSCPQ